MINTPAIAYGYDTVWYEQKKKKIGQSFRYAIVPVLANFRKSGYISLCPSEEEESTYLSGRESERRM